MCKTSTSEWSEKQGCFSDFQLLKKKLTNMQLSKGFVRNIVEQKVTFENEVNDCFWRRRLVAH